MVCHRTIQIFFYLKTTSKTSLLAFKSKLECFIMLANYHTHTPRCNHAIGNEREYIERAIECGFTVLGFSDHAPQPYPNKYHSTIRMNMNEIENYTNTLLDLRQEYKDKITILIGYEVEYTHKYFDKLMKELQKYPLDYIIQGQHFVPDEINGVYVGNKNNDEKLLASYVDLTIQGMETGLFTYLAHPDLVNFTGDDETYKKHMVRIVEASIKYNIPLEVNMLGFEDKRNYPCNRFFKMAAEMGANFVIGCDAHTPKSIKQPENIVGFMDFLKSHNISFAENLVKLAEL